MTTKKTETDTTVPRPARSIARGELHRRIVALDAAKQKVEDRKAAARRLTIMGETAKALAAQFAGLKAHSAATLAAHVLHGTGPVPKLADDGRDVLAAKLAEAEAMAESAGPAIEIVQAEITGAHGAFVRASGAVQDIIVPVLEEELVSLDQEIGVLLAKLIPLETRLVGLHRWARSKSSVIEGDARIPFLRLMNAAAEVMTAKRVSSQAPACDADERVWATLAEHLLTNPDAQPVAA